MGAALRKPLILKGGKPQQLSASDVLDVPTRTVPVYLAGGGSLKVRVASNAPAFVTTAAGATLEVLASGATGAWFIGADTDSAALATRLAAAETSVATTAAGLDATNTTVASKLDADLSALTAASAGADTDIVVIQRSASRLKLALSTLVSYITGVARSWAGVQTFSAGAALGESSPTVKCKVLDITLPAASGASVDLVAHGITAANIVSYAARVTASDTGNFCLPGNGYPNATFNIGVSSTHVRASVTGSSVAGQAGKVFIFYTA